jgi:hypothetical protein
VKKFRTVQTISRKNPAQIKRREKKKRCGKREEVNSYEPGWRWRDKASEERAKP